MTYDVQSPDAARLWAYLPDWSSGFDVRRAFKTDIAGPSRNNKEQRRALRSSPRFSVEYSTVVSEDDLRDAKLFLLAWQNKPTIIPDFARWARTTALASGGASAIVISPMPAWVAAGQNLVLCGDDGMEQVLVDSVAGTTINLVDPLSDAWVSGSVVRPTFFGLFGGKIGSVRPNRGAGKFSIAIDCYPGGEPPRAIGTAWATLNDREVFTPVPDYAGAPSISSLWPVEGIDYGQGRTAQFRPVEQQQSLVECDFRGLDVTETAELEQFFDRMKGRRNAFYLPTWEKDYVLAATAGSGTATMLAEGTALAANFGSTDYSDVEEALAVWLTDGTAIYRRITDISVSGGNSQITVDSNWGAALTVATVARISRMPLVRFASDEMTTGWRTPLASDVKLPFQSVRA